MAEDTVLGFLEKNEEISDSGDFAAERGINHNDIVNIIKSLHGFRLVDAQDIKREKWVLTDEGKTYAAAGSPEVQLFLAIPLGGLSREELQRKVDPSLYKIGCSQAMKNKWVEMGKQLVSKKVQNVDDKVKDLLIRIQDRKAIDQNDIDALKKRKLIALQLVLAIVNLITAFERVSLFSFEEMPMNNFVESSHLAITSEAPSTTKTLPEDYVEGVKYGYDWKREEANKNLLRTHTTAVSSRMLYLLAQNPFAPKKYFSIDRVFRNEAVDRTHLAEFHQIKGLVCDRGLTLGDLIGVLQDFFSHLGMSKLRFKPAYNPYTKPSMEIFSYHEGFKKWVEIGNSGMFRPEMLLPMGLPEDVRVIAWGLSLGRPTMILYGIDNIRDLFGHKVDLGLIKRNPICRIGID
ncbi:hypothetical protein L1049_003671 [Liquidambar formosana]|uniref:phenylalanine--tRNA ligase n=1 Tax=Liquidambar formosana TaxID=63359 RepID=A0AAP0RM58_LIQFO